MMQKSNQEEKQLFNIIQKKFKQNWQTYLEDNQRRKKDNFLSQYQYIVRNVIETMENFELAFDMIKLIQRITLRYRLRSNKDDSNEIVKRKRTLQ
ncbi:unnamed protein product [Paramecium primaurelia]|uniref:Uncharacterized protein n=1 Tax=Paramecium primaurelia TaxID=5886 RepID=A0A8S1N9R8_PARPR|nr:unnamed protein product [Paramecium primaurelia]